MVNEVEVPKSQWSSYLNSVTRSMEDAELSIEVGGDNLDLAAVNLALQFLAYDGRDELFEVAGATESSHVPDVFHHLVEKPRRIVADVRTTAPSRIEVEAEDGERTVIRLDRTDGP
jgi:Family of unknown function (DUF5335)